MESHEESVKWEIIVRAAVENRNNFWKAILLSAIKPHLINRRLAGAEQICIFRTNNTDLNRNGQFINKLLAYIQMRTETEIDVDYVKKAIYELQTQDEFKQIDDQQYDLNKDRQILIILNKLLSKNISTFGYTYEINIIDNGNKQAGFLNLLQNQTTGFIKKFVVHLSDSNNELTSEMVIKAANDGTDHFTRQSNWIKNVFFPKILKWITSMNDRYEDRQKSAIDGVESHSLINSSEYNELYNDLKAKYGENMVKIWPENTDPLKYVYEDVAIASYLILLWRDECRRMNTNQLQSFVDLGCGNGLLVYILSSEGHQGYGIDVRKRGIWDLYPKTTVLKTHAIVPSDRSLFPDIDWIIGNHSDELSPWIPVISARSSYKSRYFLLPCCAFEFSGKKFQRRCSTVSQYMDFLSYAQEISNVCGFKTQIDRLKIPSTKRICLIGSERIYTVDKQSDRENEIQKFINMRSNCDFQPLETWNSDFQPRSDVEKIQNCTKINRTIQNEIVDKVFNELMKKKRFLSDVYKTDWNVGGKVSLMDLAKIIPRDKLKALKSECGGLQTLLKNYSQIFQVTQGVVEIRVPIKLDDKKRIFEAKGKEIQVKQKPCWFYQNHPNGCPLSDEDCSFSH
ncbi:probable tRNA (uracil-O(2)-)-methyltransferase [Contarinia nasturtii]|uniref:probable tRNA (uracil-O(2)-)-methyltransferase n=1 Tax=Contarinia nasturtii TaxID=265458 RepID=UPI0012D3C070|nr:probable tRNA (uracil-O(2)-)-methyltransferase [Contarinia nasturtii]